MQVTEGALNMKKAILILVLTMVAAGAGPLCAAEFQGQTGIDYNWWDSNTHDRGSQLIVPVTLGTTFDAFSMKLLTAFGQTRSDPSGAQKVSLSTIVDTKVNLSYEVVDRFFFDVLFGLDFNLPTGKTRLSPDELELLMDPDLVTVNRFGEGFNVNPTITLAKIWDRWAAGIGLGYLWRGEYDFSETARHYDPGDILLLTGEVSCYFSPRWQGRLFGEVAHYGKDEVKSSAYYKEGFFSLVGVGLTHYRENWDASLTVQAIFRGRSQFQEDGGGLKTEDRDSYGNEWSADASTHFYLSKKTTLHSQLYYLCVFENEYSTASPFYIGEQQKVSLSIGLARQLTSTLKAACDLSGYVLDVGRNWYHDDSVTYRGFIISVSLTQQF
jgi:hypothetical protein